MLSVRMSVTLVDEDHILEILETNCRTISPMRSLFVAQRSSTYSRGTHGQIWGRLEAGWEKWRAGHKSGNISKTRKNRRNVTLEGL